MWSDAKIRNLPIPKKDTPHVLDPISGLTLIHRKTDVKSLTVSTRVNGVLVKRTIGQWPKVLVKEGCKRALEIKAAAGEGRDLGAEKRAAREAAKAALLVADRVDQVIEAYGRKHLDKKCSPRWAKEARRYLSVEVAPVLGKKRLGDIEDRHVHVLMTAIADRGSPRTADLTFVVFRGMCNWAKTLAGGKLIASNPCDGVTALAAVVKRKRVLSDDEIRLVWRATEKTAYPFGPIYRLALLLGLRRDEIAGLLWSEINLKGTPTLTIDGSRTKNGETLILPLPEAAVTIIESLPKIGQSKFVFTSTEKTHVTGYSRAKACVDRAILELLPEGAEAPPQWQMHDFRRTIATNMQKLGVRLEVTEAILNHVSGASRSDVAGVYHLHDWADEKRTALDAWAKRVAAIVEDAPPATNVVEIARARA
jgi:integrase